MGPAAGVCHLQGEHQPPPSAGECLEGAQLVRHEGRPRPGNPGADSPNFIIVFKILKKSEARHSVIFFTSYLGWNFDPFP